MKGSQKRKEVMPNIVIKKKFEFIRDRRYIFNVLVKTGLFILCMYLIFSYVFGVTVMQNSDMMPRISVGDLMLYYRLEKEYHSPDIVIFDIDGEEYVGRVIAIPGESIEITDSHIIKLNGNSIIEDDIFYTTYKYEDYVEYPLELDEDEYFIMCDSREGAKDSRYFGVVKESQIKGCVITVLRRNNL